MAMLPFYLSSSVGEGHCSTVHLITCKPVIQHTYTALSPYYSLYCSVHINLVRKDDLTSCPSVIVSETTYVNGDNNRDDKGRDHCKSDPPQMGITGVVSGRSVGNLCIRVYSG